MSARPRALWLLLLAPAMGVVPATQSACDDVEPALVVSGFPLDAVDVQTKMLGALDADALAALDGRADVDAVFRLPDGTCPGGCRFVELSVYVKNAGPAPLAPPVVRTRAPEGRPARAPIALAATEISPGRTGRVRAVVELWPEERTLDAHLSSSVFIAVDTAHTPDDPPR